MLKTMEQIAKDGFVTVLPVELVDKEIKAITVNDWRIQNKVTFDVSYINIVKIVKHSHGFNVEYTKENSNFPMSVLVPPAFTFKMLDNDKLKEVIKKYELAQLENLNRICSFTKKIGSDPEIFVENSKGSLIPAFNFLGSKEKPDITHRDPGGYSGSTPNTLYWDGFQAEFTTDASHCMGWHGDSLQCGLEGIWLKAKKFNKNAKLSIKTVFDIPAKLLKTSKPEHVTFGCNPSLNAYDMKGLEMPGHLVDYRSAGGHLHFEMNYKPEEYTKIVKALDAILGVACVSMFAKYDDPRRRMMYGLAGEYRLPPHGLEYRTLSNAWLFHPVIANIVFDLARSTAMFGLKGFLKHWNATEEETIECINTCNVTKAREILKRNEVLFKKILNARYNRPKATDYALKAILEGMESIIKDPNDIVKNWNLGKKWQAHCDGTNKNVDRCFDVESKLPKGKI